MISFLKLCPSRALWWRGGVIVAAGLGVLVRLEAEEAKAKAKAVPPMPEFRQLAPLAGVQAAAKVAGIPLEGIASPLERATLRERDAVTALVSLTSGAKLQQWVIALSAVAPTAKEKEKGGGAPVFYSSSGRELRFESERAALEIRSIGPLTADDAGARASTDPKIKRARATVAADYLALGLDRPPAMGERIKQRKEQDPNLPSGNLSIGMKPFPPEVVAASRPGLEAVGITEADERAVIGSILALVEFFQVASRTPGIQEVVTSVIDVPWWSIIRSGGKMPGLNLELLPNQSRIDAKPWMLSAADVWAVPLVLQLNGQPALVCQLAVTSPRPPLLPCAGIVGLAARRPDGKGPVLTLQIVAAGTEGGETLGR